jgi:hypothetical protein
MMQQVSGGLLVLAAEPPAESQTPRWWGVFLAIAAIVGLAAGLQQLVSWVSSRRRRRAEDRLLKIVESQLRAEEAQAAAERYSTLRAELRRQVENEIPREARRIFLLNRRDRLASSITEDLQEYTAIEQELAETSDLGGSPLDERVRAVVQETIVPSQEARRRRERAVLAIVAALLLLSFSPFPVGYFISSYFEVVGYSDRYTSMSIVFTMALGIIVVALVAYLSYGPVLTRLRRIQGVRHRLHRSRLFVFAATLAGSACTVLGFYWRNLAEVAVRAPYQSDEVWQATQSRIGWYRFGAGVCLNVSVALVGLILAIAIVKLRPRHARNLQTPTIQSESSGPVGQTD